MPDFLSLNFNKSIKIIAWTIFYMFTSMTSYPLKNVIMSAMESEITGLTIVYSAVYFWAQIKENIKDPSHWPLCREFTGGRWIPRKNGQKRGKYFHLMTSSFYAEGPTNHKRKYLNKVVYWLFGARETYHHCLGSYVHWSTNLMLKLS